MFRDRDDAGEQLAKSLSAYRGEIGGLVLALPRGGVVIGSAISRCLGWPLDVFISLKLRFPLNQETAFGALTETGHRYMNPGMKESEALPPAYVKEELHRRELEVRWRRMLYRGGRPLPDLKNRAVILADDGIATGATFTAALKALRLLGPRLIIAAIPVGPRSVITELEDLADDMAVLRAPEHFGSVGAYYRDFDPVPDAVVLEKLSLRRGIAGAHRKLYPLG